MCLEGDVVTEPESWDFHNLRDQADINVLETKTCLIDTVYIALFNLIMLLETLDKCLEHFNFWLPSVKSLIKSISDFF